MNTEKILCAAIKTTDGYVHALPRPNRHNDILRDIPKKELIGHEQGFMTWDGVFVSRVAAYKIAKEAGQLLSSSAPEGFPTSVVLHSEDLW
jgi:hypothetical protein